ncbi:MAG: 5-methylcytosine-specific restriction enzyme B [Firmicutes bacterium ADurb.Bin146]|nr:MAG: 5-methylcytosine-specific restriction enzyme B [Firmicutes bacterium ADurb.Bin146]
MSIKAKFFEYLGHQNSLSGYVRSYKLVFLIILFELLSDKGMAKAIDVARRFKKFYEDRKEKGLVSDVDVEPRIENIESSTINQVLSVIKDNPYRVISDKGFINIEIIDGEEYFVLDKELYREINDADREHILQLLRDKIDLYFRRIDSEVDDLQNQVILRKLVEEFMENYISLRTSTPFGRNPIGSILTNKIPKLIGKYSFIDKSIYEIKGSYGNGNWNYTPWIAIFNKRITTTAQEGVYIVYLFSSDMERVYLTLNQGCKRLSESVGKREAINTMQELSNKVRSQIDSRGFHTNNNLNIGHELYEKGTIFYKVYEKGSIPEDDRLINDLAKMMDIYQEYYSHFVNKPSVDEQANISISTPSTQDMDLSVKDEIERISLYIRSKGFTYQDDLIKNFYLALKSKPFVILAGTSGTGKSKLIRLFAEAIGATSENERFKLISVRPDWSDSTDLLGYMDLNGRFHAGVLTNIIVKALHNPNYPFLVCLDEMNLARVEYYLSDILSIMESRKWNSGEIVTDRLIENEYLESSYIDTNHHRDIIIPENLYIIGTVNMDETTFPFSKKVLDRANTIEFSYVDLDIKAESIEKQQPVILHNSFLRSEYLLLEDCMKYEEQIIETISILKEINSQLQPANLNFGYRIRDEICFYMIYNHIHSLLSFNEAMDNAILQKILPRIQGSNSSIKRSLTSLFKICINNSAQILSYESAGVSEEMFEYINEHINIPYKKSAEKIAFMMRRFEEDGFTSYWL